MTRYRTLVAVLLPALVAISPARGENYQRIEAESFYTPTGEIPGCGPPISIQRCDAASNGLGVDGVDCAGEWIPFEIVVPGPYMFRIEARSAAVEGFVRQFQFRFLNVDDAYAEVAADSLVTGAGLGFA